MLSSPQQPHGPLSGCWFFTEDVAFLVLTGSRELALRGQLLFYILFSCDPVWIRVY